MSRERIARMIEWQAASCAELGSPLYATLLPCVADDVRAGGVCAEALAEYEDAPGPDAIALRLLGGVHALVLTGRAPELAEHYAEAAAGALGQHRTDALWAAFRDTVGGSPDWIRDWMTRPPQTNEAGRANVLLPGALYALSRLAPASRPAPRVRLFELGASAGLNLRADRFRYAAPGFAWGPEDSPVRLDEGAWRGPVPAWLTDAATHHPELTVTERAGCDLSPVDPLSADGALALRAYVWPDQAARAARLEGAIRLAAKVPARVERAGVAEFLAGVAPEPGTVTVVWHSIMRQYVPKEEWARAAAELDRLARASGPDAGFAYVTFEPERVGNEGDDRPCRLSVRTGTGPARLLAGAVPHGMPAYGLD
ncbi:DUF2332 domain-containing protein [Streptomyces armeniacus]|uniref:DUF2332 domain-containing protein n=1 Tax=Streptomyces armeniacus TaxID=83291 RepID=A0A345XK01_9ACTN|nr:DUF2332 domain-containing protein [Streptomyces armeniacus]AXK31967.1 DUF2332 domain-containing protein [Streptomyces armeniacus]